MGANVEIRERRDVGSSATPIPEKTLPGQKPGFPRKRRPSEVDRREGFVEVFDSIESY